MIAGMTTKDPPTTHYREKNGSMCLQVEESPPHRQATWLFNNKYAIASEKHIVPKYKDKVDYNPSNHSLCINNLTETDSGIYTFSFLNFEYKSSEENHKVIVEETVPRPVMRVSGLHSNLSAALCNITVNCSIRDEWVWSFCDGEGCRTSQRSLRKVNITIFTDNTSIVCSGNNHVSTSKVYESIEATCLRKPNPEHEETSEPPTVLVIVIVTVIALCVSLCAFAVCVVKGLSSIEYNQHQAEAPAAGITQSQQVEAKPHSVSSVSTSSSSQAEACYENVDATQPCQTSSPTIRPREEPGSQRSQKVDTVYSVLPAVTSSLGKSERHETTQETWRSKYVPLEEEEHVDTLYSVLQLPRKATAPAIGQTEVVQKPKR
ncbi:hypothetical protein VZT92_017265 [Zoarces viviparus]